jgi:hypothetical protein
VWYNKNMEGTLTELITACGKDFVALHKVVGGFRADGNKESHEDEDIENGGIKHFEEMGDTPEHAVENLLLKLQVKI